MFRLTHMMGWDDTVWNHITARAPETDHTFFMHQFGLLYEEIKASNLIKVDENGRAFPYHKLTNKYLQDNGKDLQLVLENFQGSPGILIIPPSPSSTSLTAPQ